MTNISTTQTFNGAIPMQGPQVLKTPVTINTTFDDVIIDLKLQLSTGQISGIQTIYVDLSDYPSDVIFTCLDTQQQIKCVAGSQGYYPILSTNLMKFKVRGNAEGTFDLFFINFPIAAGVWGLAGIKGDQGEQGIPGQDGADGANGTQVYNAAGTQGEKIGVPSGSNLVLKQLVGGTDIEVSTSGNLIYIDYIGTGGGSGGGGTGTIPAPSRASGGFSISGAETGIDKQIYFNGGQLNSEIVAPDLTVTPPELKLLQTGLFQVQAKIEFYNNNLGTNPNPPNEITFAIDTEDGLINAATVPVTTHFNGNYMQAIFNCLIEKADQYDGTDEFLNYIKLYVKSASEITDAYATLRILKLSDVVGNPLHPVP